MKITSKTTSIENNIKGFRATRFFLNDILQMSKFEFFVLQDRFSKPAQIFLKFANVEHNWKIQKLKNSFEKLVRPWQAKLNN